MFSDALLSSEVFRDGTFSDGIFSDRIFSDMMLSGEVFSDVTFINVWEPNYRDIVSLSFSKLKSIKYLSLNILNIVSMSLKILWSRKCIS